MSGGPEGKLILGVHVKDTISGSTDARFAGKMNATPNEMVVPPLAPRVEQFRNDLSLGVYPCKVRPLVQVAINACESEILQGVAPAVHPGNDVLNVKRGQRRVILVELAVLAAISGPLSDTSPCVLVHRSRSGGDKMASLALEDGHKLVCAYITLVFRSLRF